MITDLVFLNGHSVDAILEDFDHSLGIWLSAKNMDSIALAQLGELLQVATYDELFDAFELVSEPAEQVLFAFPGVLRSKLITLSESDMEAVCSKWKDIEEFGGGMSLDHCMAYLKSLRAFLASSEEDVYLLMGI